MAERRVYRLDSGRASWRTIDDEVVVLHSESGLYLTVTGTGSFLWPLLERGSDRIELVQALVSAFQADPEVVGRDVDDFVQELGRAGLLVPEA